MPRVTRSEKAMPEQYRAAVIVAAWGTLRRGEVLGLERKHGRSGTFDVMRYRERLLSGDALIASATSTFILPRRAG